MEENRNKDSEEQAREKQDLAPSALKSGTERTIVSLNLVLQHVADEAVERLS